MTSSYGPIVTAWTVEQAVRDTLQAWIDTILGEQERQSAGRWDLRQIKRPRSWFIQSAFHEIPERHLPSINVESSSVVFEHAADGWINGDFTMAVQGVVKAGGQGQPVSAPNTPRELVRELNAIFEAACSTILDKHGDLGLDATVYVQEANYELVPPDRDRTLMGFEIPIVVSVPNIRNRFGGPTAPDDPPTAPLPSTSPEDPEHETTAVTVSHL
jgi:hypothetical protein